MKTLTLLICVLFLSNCGSLNKENTAVSVVDKTPFTIDGSEFQNWAAGAKEAGTGTNVTIDVTNLPEGIIFNEIHYNGMISEAKLISKNNKMLVMGYFKNEMEQDIIMSDNPLMEAQNTPQKRSQHSLENDEALIIYTIKGKQEAFKISNMVEQPFLAFPGANPNKEGMGIGN